MFSEVNQLSGKQNIGGTVFANAFTANSTVTNCPLSPDVSAPICFAPWRAMAFEGHWPIARWLLQLHLGCRLTIICLECITINHCRWFIKFTVVALKLVALAKLVFVLLKHYFAKWIPKANLRQHQT